MKPYLLFLFFTFSTRAYTQEFYSAQRFGGTARDLIYSTVIDSMGNNYHVGYFSSSISFPNSSVVLISKGKTDIFFTKFNADGILLWARQIGGTSEEDAWDMLMLDNGTLLLCGRFKGTTDLDMGPNESLLINSGTGYNVFLANYDKDGNLIWNKQFTGDKDNSPYNLRVDSNGSMILSGRFTGSFDFDPDPNSSYTQTSAGGLNSYLIKLNADGIFQWGKHFSSNTGALAVDLAVIDESIYFVGNFQGNLKIFPENTPTKTSLGVNDLFITKFDSDGNLDTLIAYGTPRNDEFSSILVGATRIYLTGTFIDQIDIDPDPNHDEILVSNGGVDAFAIAFDNDFRLQWAQHFGGTDFDLGSKIRFGQDGNLLNVVKYNLTMNLEVAGATQSFTSAGGTDSAILTMDPEDGKVKAVYEIKGSGEEYPKIYFYDAESLLISGGFESSVDFNDTPSGNLILTSQGLTDCFIMRADLRLNTATKDLSALKPMQFFPMPAPNGETIHLNIEYFIGNIRMVDLSGRIVYSNQLTSATFSLPLSIPPGLYLVVATEVSGVQFGGILIVQ